MSAIVADDVDPKKRRMLILATSAVGAGAGVATAVPFVFSMMPSARALAAGAPVEYAIDKIEPGQLVTIEYRGAPHWVIRRTPEMVAQLAKNDAILADPQSEDSEQPSFAKNAHRSANPEFFVVKGVCTHLGCSPTYRKEIAPADLGADWPGGFFCPCHQSKFDMAGRVFKGMPAPKNLSITPYKIEGAKLVIDAEIKGA
ncbi:MAG TPA: ubiquinol-cytochrome c reductase iron-sulfur subunit [Usitatibacteraceae bacterium]|nr:ubiquinol-cytochrome c reductase iron-sulfur subunit [Usitatibacteraceae bacterium]